MWATTCQIFRIYIFFPVVQHYREILQVFVNWCLWLSLKKIEKIPIYFDRDCRSGGIHLNRKVVNFWRKKMARIIFFELLVQLSQNILKMLNTLLYNSQILIPSYTGKGVGYFFGQFWIFCIQNWPKMPQSPARSKVESECLNFRS